MDNDAEVSAVGRRIVTEDGFFGTVLYDGPVKNDGRYFGIEWDDASRGKHSGTFQGTTYFTTTTPDSGSFLSADSKKLAPQTCFLAALEDKYQLDQPDDGLVLLGANQKVQVKTVGWEKIRQKQSNLSRLEIVGLANCRIGPLQRDAYIPESIASTCPFIQDLDLSKNLLGSWSDVAGIAKELKQLKSLRLAQCRFDPVVNGVDLEGAFEQVRALTLNATLMSWASLEQVIKYMPQLKELHFGWNELSEFGGNGEDLQSLGWLELLNLETNKISSWKEIKRLSRLSIKQLYLLGNPIDMIEAEETDFFSKLEVLHLHRTLIKDWMTVHQLNKFPSLRELRLKDVPIFKDGSEGRRSDLIARVSKITVLNGSEITDRRRQDAELYYLDHAFAKIDDPNFEKEHPRYAELVRIHGPPTPVPVHLTSNLLKDRMIEISFRYGDKTLKKKLMNTMQLRMVRTMMVKLFRIPASMANDGQLVWRERPDFVLEDEWKDLNFYSIESGHELELKAM